MSGSVSFDRAVEYYDRTRGMSDETSRRVTALLGEELRGRGRCLEIGVGTGIVGLPLARAGIPMVGLDLSAPMLHRLHDKSGGRSPFPLVVGDATRLPFRDGGFGGAVVRHVLHLIPAWEQAIGEVARVLAGGAAVLVTRGDIPGPWREATDRFRSLVGEPSFAAGLRAWDAGHVDRAFARHGARSRTLPAIPERVEQSLGTFIDQMGEGMHSWTWEVDEDIRRDATSVVRRWALERFGTLDPPGAREVTIEWWAYDLP